MHCEGEVHLLTRTIRLNRSSSTQQARKLLNRILNSRAVLQSDIIDRSLVPYLSFPSRNVLPLELIERMNQLKEVVRHTLSNPSARSCAIHDWCESEILAIRAIFMERLVTIESRLPFREQPLRSEFDKIVGMTDRGAAIRRVKSFASPRPKSATRETTLVTKEEIANWRARRTLEAKHLRELQESAAQVNRVRQQDEQAKQRIKRELVIQYKREIEKREIAEERERKAHESHQRIRLHETLKTTGFFERVTQRNKILLNKRRAKSVSRPITPSSPKKKLEVSSKLYNTTTALLLRMKAIEEDQQRRKQEAQDFGRSPAAGLRLGGTLIHRPVRAMPQWRPRTVA